jgi:3-hydroxyacyl-[acyl-carrier-protein] dehydratase
LEHARRVVATLELPADLEVFAHHFPGNPMLPASTLMEGFAQTASILLETSSRFEMKALPGFVREAKFRRVIRPGLLLTMEMVVEQWHEDAVLLRGLATQGGKRCASCELGMVLTPFSGFFDAGATEEYQRVYQQWLKDVALKDFDFSPLELLINVSA